MWPDRRLLDLFGIERPIVQAPMAGAGGSAVAIAAAEAGALGSLPCATIDAAQARAELGVIRQCTARPIDVNVFCHARTKPDAVREAAWRARLAPYYAGLGLAADAAAPAVNREPFDDALCRVIEEARPEVGSFHFGLPEPALLARVRAAGCLIMSSATTVAEARWLEDHGVDAVIAQGSEAGGHRGGVRGGRRGRADRH